MSRWEPDARGRLQAAALDLFVERGFEATTVADIAARAGVTERTFFRHYPDKREVLFSGSARLQQLMVEAVDAAPAGTNPIEAVAGAVAAAARVLQVDRPHALRRQAALTANHALQERELVKLASMSAALAAGLVRRAVPELAARLTADAGVSVLRIAFESWLEDPAERTMEDIADEAFASIRAAVTNR